jgi:hypothetical protein
MNNQSELNAAEAFPWHWSVLWRGAGSEGGMNMGNQAIFIMTSTVPANPICAGNLVWQVAKDVRPVT